MFELKPNDKKFVVTNGHELQNIIKSTVTVPLKGADPQTII